jgi:hypothetical protein
MVHKTKIIEKYGKDRFLKEVINPQGKKGDAYIFQGWKAGFSSASMTKSGNHKRVLPYTSYNAEALARKLARKGYKKVEFRD